MNLPEHLLNAKICNKDTCEEIRTLKEELEKKNKKYWQSKCFEYQVENRRLNNILNALEESYIEDIEKLESFGIERQVEIAEIISCYKFYLRRLRELKESDK